MRISRLAARQEWPFPPLYEGMLGIPTSWKTQDRNWEALSNSYYPLPGSHSSLSGSHSSLFGVSLVTIKWTSLALSTIR